MGKSKEPRIGLTAALVQSSTQQLRRTNMSLARARVLAPGIERLNAAALAAADDNDFNDEPSRFTAMLARLKSPAVRR
jgi:hypothetical protein